MNEALVDMWNRDVKPEDTVYFLGDFAMKFNKVEEFLPRLNGNIKYNPGNHCSIHPMHKGHQNTLKKFKAIKVKGSLEVSGPETLMITGGLFLLMCHFPWAEVADDHSEEHNSYDDRFKEWKPKRADFCKKTWLLSGHRHSKPQNRVGDRVIDVGFDPWGRMVNLEEILEIVNSVI